jgi:hypothetical protein
MDRKLATLLADQELLEVKRMGYRALVEHVKTGPTWKEIVGPDGKQYQIKIVTFWDSETNGPIRVSVEIDDGTLWRAMFPLAVGDVVYPDQSSD